MEPFITNDAVVLGLLISILAGVFYTSGLKTLFWTKFYKFVPALLLCYFVPSLFNSAGLISAEWFTDGVFVHLESLGFTFSNYTDLSQIQALIDSESITSESLDPFRGHSNLYFVASRFLLPASLVLLCLSIDMKGIISLGPKALIMFFTATAGIVIGGPIAIMVISVIAPGVLDGAGPDEVWRGLSTVAGSWIGGGANQTAMNEIYEPSGKLFSAMITVDVIVANVWMAFLLVGAGMSDKVDKVFKADNSAINALKSKIENYQASISRVPTLTDIMVILFIGLGCTGLAHFLADLISPFMKGHMDFLEDIGLESLAGHFFWLVVIATTAGLILSFTRLKSYEGAGASRIGSVFLYILVATIGMKMDILAIFENPGLFLIGGIWMLVHVALLLGVGKLIKAPFFFTAVGSQANVGGAASAPIVASAFSPALAPVGVLLAVFGYALGTYMAIVCAELMRIVSS